MYPLQKTHSPQRSIYALAVVLLLAGCDNQREQEMDAMYPCRNDFNQCRNDEDFFDDERGYLSQNDQVLQNCRNVARANLSKDIGEHESVTILRRGYQKDYETDFSRDSGKVSIYFRAYIDYKFADIDERTRYHARCKYDLANETVDSVTFEEARVTYDHQGREVW